MSAPVPSPAPEIILALDLPQRQAAFSLLHQLKGPLQHVKIGLGLFCAYGPAIVHEVAALGYRVFLDLKLHDIPNTVAHAVRSLAGLPVSLLTVHAGGGPAMLQAALEAQQQHLPHTRLLGVTVLTSVDAPQWQALGYPCTPGHTALHWAQLAVGCGLNGLVCSPHELADFRQALGQHVYLVTPGIRAGTGSEAPAPTQDQKRTLSAQQAASLGASALVVGRPIYADPNPLQALLALQQSLGSMPGQNP
jgi:orotidine-5'-phosphate decarboxylase